MSVCSLMGGAVVLAVVLPSGVPGLVAGFAHVLLYRAEAWAAGHLASRARSLFLGDKPKEPKKVLIRSHFWLFLGPVRATWSLEPGTWGGKSPSSVPCRPCGRCSRGPSVPCRPCGVQSGLAGGLQETHRCPLLPRSSWNERATSSS